MRKIFELAPIAQPSTGAPSRARRYLPRVTAVLTSYIATRCTGLTPKQIESIVWQIGLSLLTLRGSLLHNHCSEVQELLKTQAVGRRNVLREVPLLRPLQNCELIMSYDAECTLLLKMADTASATARERMTEADCRESIFALVYENVTHAIPALLDVAPLGYTDCHRAGTITKSPTAPDDLGELEVLKALALKYHARGLYTEACIRLARGLSLRAAYAGQVTKNRPPSVSFVAAIYEFLLAIKNRLDLRDIQEELTIRQTVAPLELSFDMPLGFIHPVLIALTPEILPLCSPESMQRHLHHNLSTEWNAVVTQALQKRNAMLQSVETPEGFEPSAFDTLMGGLHGGVDPDK